jgi:putative YphP/YqiW family bacilliredoxin
MPYDPMLVEPMRQEARQLGAEELLDAASVHAALKDFEGTALVLVNSVCGCAAGGARPGLQMALAQAEVRPDRVYTVFAGQDLEATAAARQYFAPYQPSSPQIGLLKDGKLVHMVQRHDIEGRAPQDIAEVLRAAFAQHCG